MDQASSDWNRAKTVFQSMLEMNPEDWQPYLDEQSLPQELSRTVQELLQAHQEAGSFLDPGALHASFFAETQAIPQIGDGDVLAERFKIVRFKARGGMGEVYESNDLELQMPVAVKVIRAEIANYPGVLSRFRREVQLAKQVTHPNVCRIFDIFRHRDSASREVVFLTMEWLRGETLSERLRREGRLAETEIIALLHQIASGLQAAHAVGILHRDLKPGNIVLEPGRNADTRAVITDFGMALSGDSSAATTRTASGQFGFGTPQYMSPEQIEGKELSAASDIYSLGLVAYQMLTGVRAFEAETPLYSALRRLTEEPPYPTRAQPALNSRWDALIRRSLERNPERRFPQLAEFDAALTSIETARGKRKGDVASGHAAARRWIAKHWRMNAAASVLAAGAIGSLFGVRHFQSKPAPAEALTVVLADFVNTTGEPTFDNALNVALAAKLQQTPYLTLMPEQKIAAALQYMSLPPHQKLSAEVARQICEREAGHVVLQGFIAPSARGYAVGLHATNCQTGKEIATTQFPVEFRDSVLDGLDRAAEAIRPILGESMESIRKYDVPLGEATTSSFEAVTAFAQGTDAWNERGEAAALPFFQRATEIDPNFAMAYARLGTVYGNMGETERANEAMQQAFDRRDRVTEWERFYIVSHYYGFVTGQVDKEMQTYEEWARAYPHDMAWTINLSVDYAFTGQYEKAIELQRRAIREVPGLSPSYGNLAQLFLAIDQPDEAATVIDQATHLNLHDVNIQLDQYELAFYRNETATMSKLLAGASQVPGVEDTLLAQQAATDDRAGHLRAGAQLAFQAAHVAAQAGASETGATWLAGEAVRQIELGNPKVSRTLIALVLADGKGSRGSDVKTLLALATSQSGETARAQSLIREVNSARSLDTLIQSYWLPILRARVAFAEGHYKRAIEDLEGTDSYDLGIFTPGQCMDASYARAQVLLANHQPLDAAAAFRRILAHRGLVLNCPTSALAQLGLARSLVQSGKSAAGKAAYQDLLALWKDGDPDFALLKQARTEYGLLNEK